MTAQQNGVANGQLVNNCVATGQTKHEIAKAMTLSNEADHCV